MAKGQIRPKDQIWNTFVKWIVATGLHLSYIFMHLTHQTSMPTDRSPNIKARLLLSTHISKEKY